MGSDDFQFVFVSVSIILTGLFLVSYVCNLVNVRGLSRFGSKKCLNRVPQPWKAKVPFDEDDFRTQKRFILI